MRARVEHAAHPQNKKCELDFLSRASLSLSLGPAVVPGSPRCVGSLAFLKKSEPVCFSPCLKKVLRHTENCVTQISSPSPSNTERRCGGSTPQILKRLRPNPKCMSKSPALHQAAFHITIDAPARSFLYRHTSQGSPENASCLRFSYPELHSQKEPHSTILLFPPRPSAAANPHRPYSSPRCVGEAHLPWRIAAESELAPEPRADTL